MLTFLRSSSRFWIAGTVSMALIAGCATQEVAPDKTILPEVPEYVKVPHPIGYELAEIRALFESPLAPKDGLGSFANHCDKEYQLLLKATASREDRKAGAEELVSDYAEKMHWCFYGKVTKLIKELKAEQEWKARQKIVLDAYEFLTPIASAFLSVYQDSRYLRWATQYYSSISEWVFFRKVVPGPENTLALTMSASSDLENWTNRTASGEKKLSVFTRYGISMNQEEGSRSPASTGFGFAEEPEVLDALQTDPGFTPQVPDTIPTPLGDKKPGSKTKRKPATKETNPDTTPFAL